MPFYLVKTLCGPAEAYRTMGETPLPPFQAFWSWKNEKRWNVGISDGFTEKSLAIYAHSNRFLWVESFAIFIPTFFSVCNHFSTRYIYRIFCKVFSLALFRLHQNTYNAKGNFPWRSPRVANFSERK